MSEVEFQKKDNLTIRAGDSRGFIQTQTVEAHLLFAILEKLEEISAAVKPVTPIAQTERKGNVSK